MSDAGCLVTSLAILLAAGLLVWARRTWRARRRREVDARSVTLRDVQDADGRRRLVARLDADGDVVIEGWDYGDGVEKIFGYREYEWVWTLAATDVPALLQALEAPDDDVIGVLGRRFRGDAAADLGSFLESHGIEVEAWSRIGD